jgi:pyridoxal phosphate enzyme (YggS family)
MAIQENLTGLMKNIPAGCTLIAVSKTQPVEKVIEAYDCGQRAFGENKVQELAAKYEALPKDIAWHMIGHLQTNKVKYIASFISLIHAVDSVKLLQEINKQAVKAKRVIPCLLQIHIAEEETKFGFSGQEVMELLSSSTWNDLQNIQVKGLMGMATFTENEDQVRREFKSLKTFFEKLKSSSLPDQFRMQELSMGMSGDFKIALEEGSTMIRVGTAIFGQRNYS